MPVPFRFLCLPLFGLLLSAAAPAERWRVVAVPDGDTLELEDGRRVRLAGIEAAKPPRSADPGDGRRWPLAEAATAALSELALGRVVMPRPNAGGEAIPDRHGRPMAQLMREDGVWLQGEMLARGHARVHTRPDARGFAREMLAAEETARARNRGLWRTRIYAVRGTDPATLARDRDSFQIVEGRVLHVSKAGGEAYLDFGEDWRTDTTIHIPRAVMRDFGKAGIDPLSYEGRRIRVRGWIGLRSGPMIAITHPEQIERLEDGPSPGTADPTPRSDPPAPEAGPDDEDESE
ncbi:thermonuclease family protein [Azospirillum doebereinerae]|uniref:Thermonuclease family protein n=1 Tax=Azospirillum doebereinerae TaxID=92933 RepID=A0A433JB20_9PROT|nr:thermonuclease family protein [Azospirillum doebereinerae]RUQ73656.1 thermonuclease family protein [Azospirillum doebereinerae]